MYIFKTSFTPVCRNFEKQQSLFITAAECIPLYARFFFFISSFRRCLRYRFVYALTVPCTLSVLFVSTTKRLIRGETEVSFPVTRVWKLLRFLFYVYIVDAGITRHPRESSSLSSYFLVSTLKGFIASAVSNAIIPSDTLVFFSFERFRNTPIIIAIVICFRWNFFLLHSCMINLLPDLWNLQRESLYLNVTSLDLLDLSFEIWHYLFTRISLNFVIAI